MTDQADFDSRTWAPGTAAAAGDSRENDPQSPGFTDDEDRLYRSHFQHANQLADRRYEHVRPAYQLGQSVARDPRMQDRSFEEIQTDLERGWLNVRTATGDWASVREFARTGFDRARGRVPEMPRAGSPSSHDRATYADPLPGDTDATEPSSPG